MSGTDLWQWSATRVEIDHRAREARLRIERLESLLGLRLQPTRPRLKWGPYPRGLRFLDGGRTQGRSEKVDSTGGHRRHARHFPAEGPIPASRLAVAAEAATGSMLRRPSAA